MAWTLGAVLGAAHMGGQRADDWFMREVLPLELALTRFLQRNWRCASDIPDLRQEVYARAYEAALLELPQLVRPFLFRIARNLMIDRIRRQNVVSLETIENFDSLVVADEEVSPEGQVVARQQLRLLQSALNEMPPRCRKVIVLCKVEGLSQKEVAARMGITVDTVENQVAKGIRLLTRAMAEHRGALISRARRFNFLNRMSDVS